MELSMKRTLLTLLLLTAAQSTFAGGFHQCTGKITKLVTRATGEGTQLTMQGLNGAPRVGFGGSAQSDKHERQFSMLLAAHLAGRPVRLEFEDSSLDCSSNHNGILIRYVMIEG
jgi:hypothetical protein